MADPTNSSDAALGHDGELRGCSFVVYGVAAPAGSKTAQVSPRGKVFVRDASKRSAPWKRLVAQAAGEAMAGAGLLEGPLSLTVAVVIPRPKSHYGARGLRPSAPSAPTTRPDLTKYLRGIEDAMTGIVWRDDAQVITQSAEKRYGEPARVSVRVLEVGP